MLRGSLMGGSRSKIPFTNESGHAPGATETVDPKTAYSLGALLARKAVRLPAFFETMRSLCIMRLILFVWVPWLCHKLALNWQQILARYPAMHTWRGLFYILEGLWVMIQWDKHRASEGRQGFSSRPAR
jgi:hypothetical protein